MNIEIADRLVKMRKEKGLSQEALANELGISRQAVSKWERAEASPDTDNLIMLAKLYNVSLDDLLNSDQTDFESSKQTEPKEERRDKVDISLTKGIHVSDKDGSEVHVGWDGIHVDDKKESHNVHVDSKGVFVDGEEKHFKDHHKKDFPIFLIVLVGYIIAGVFYDLWHPGWIIFLSIPIIESFIKAIKMRNPLMFAYPVLAALVFFVIGFGYDLWHPGWVVFLTIPLYYSIVGFIYSKNK